MNRPVPVRFLLGPAGTGKTHRCLAEVRAELCRHPDGLPLLFLAPKQATYQLERRLLEDDSLAGWSRLQILSFDRLARQIVGGVRPLEVLDEEGRLMVLRALLRRLAPRLRVFRASARLAGFAQELSATLREFQCHHLAGPRLEEVRSRGHWSGVLADKLHDLALLLGEYRTWLAAQGLVDADLLPDLAVEALHSGAVPFHVAGLWLDGFAEMTPQEIELLAAVVERSEQSLIAFCLEGEPREEASWLSTWSVLRQTFRRCHTRLAAVRGASLTVEVLPRTPGPTRFHPNPVLAHLEESWSRPAPCPQPASGRLRFVSCRDTENEAETAAREIWAHVRQGGRFRDIAVLVRALEPVQAEFERVFLRYGIPYFLDRRAPLAHHPFAELIRFALRLAAFGWLHDDWFGFLKTGLARVPVEVVDRAENDALRLGWGGEFWRRLSRSASDPAPDAAEATARRLEPVLPDILRFVDDVSGAPSARELTDALTRLGVDLQIRATLEGWDDNGRHLDGMGAIHLGAWEQILAWQENLRRGFGDERLPLSEWLPVLEAGLAALTAGVIPPAQDQVLIGAIDRSRQPDLRLAIVAGLNEGRFPAAPKDSGLLTENEREDLAQAGIWLGTPRRLRLGHERYLGYIAFTRARDRLVLTWSQRDDAGRPLAPSMFVDLVRARFPDVAIESSEAERIDPAQPAAGWAGRLEHPVEILPWLLAREVATPLDGFAGNDLRRAWLRQWRIESDRGPGRLNPGIAARLIGDAPEVSVSALESFAACPFQFFVLQTLRGREREQYEADARQSGSLAHEILAAFHASVRSESRRWADLAPDEARSRLAAVAPAIVDGFGGGVCRATPEASWQTDALLEKLADLVATLVLWARSCAFEPTAAELAFGGSSALAAWRVPLDERRVLRVRGKADRVDLLTVAGDRARFLVIDYKLRAPRLDDRLIVAGIDLQLAAYALALADLGEWVPHGPRTTEVAGMFYVGVFGRPPAEGGRNEAESPGSVRSQVHRHRGRFRADAVDALDSGARTTPSGQFAIRLNRDGTLRKGGDGRDNAAFEQLLGAVLRSIQLIGNQMIAGVVEVAPFGCGTRTACGQCALRPVCRFDPWCQGYRRLGESS